MTSNNAVRFIHQMKEAIEGMCNSNGDKLDLYDEWFVLPHKNKTKNPLYENSPRLVSKLLSMDSQVFAEQLYEAKGRRERVDSHILQLFGFHDCQVQTIQRTYVLINFRPFKEGIRHSHSTYALQREVPSWMPSLISYLGYDSVNEDGSIKQETIHSPHLSYHSSLLPSNAMPPSATKVHPFAAKFVKKEDVGPRALFQSPTQKKR